MESWKGPPPRLKNTGFQNCAPSLKLRQQDFLNWLLTAIKYFVHSNSFARFNLSWSMEEAKMVSMLT